MFSWTSYPKVHCTLTYANQQLHFIKPYDNLKRYDFSVDNMLNENFLELILFSDGLPFILLGSSIGTMSGYGQRLTRLFTMSTNVTHPTSTFGAALLEIASSDRCSFAESTVTSTTYLDMPQLFLLTQIENENLVFQQYGTPFPHFAKMWTDFLNERFPNKWIVKGGRKSGHLNSQTWHLWMFFLGVMSSKMSIMNPSETCIILNNACKKI